MADVPPVPVQPVLAGGVTGATDGRDNSIDQPVTTTRQPTASRRGHRKSRQGCLSCKKRKIKCQETFPTCGNCARLSIRCQYIQTSAIIAPRHSFIPQPALSTSLNFSLTDFQLFHHYLVAAFPHFPLATEDIWLNYITPISHQSDFLMHAILGLSASHLSKISPASFTAVAQNHRLKASKGLNEALSGPLKSVEEADAVIAACHALLLQSCLVSQEIRHRKVQSVLADGDSNSGVEIMSRRLTGTPSFDAGFISEAASSLNAILPLCSEPYQQEFQGVLMENILSLAQTAAQAYQAHAGLCRFIVGIGHEDFISLCDPRNTVCQLLIAHFVALHLVMRPISCRERKKYTVSMYRIRMSTWIDTIYQNLDSGGRAYLDWPVNISNLHRLEKLDTYILSQALNGGQEIRAEHLVGEL